MENRPHSPILIAYGDRTRALLWAVQAESQKRACRVAPSVAESLELLRTETFDMVMAGSRFDDGAGRQVLEAALADGRRPRLVAILQADTNAERKHFDQLPVDEYFIRTSPLSELALLWRIWLGPA